MIFENNICVQVMSNTEKGTANWVSGIESKNFRVGSPTCFTSSASNNMAGTLLFLLNYYDNLPKKTWLAEKLDAK